MTGPNSSPKFVNVLSKKTLAKHTCALLPEQPKLLYPTDVAVSSDGRVVYAISTSCNGAYNTWGRIFPEDILPDCSDTGLSFRQQAIFQLGSNQRSEQVFKDLPFEVGCKLGRELEIDHQNNLYLVNTVEKQVVKLSPSGQLTTVLEVTERSNAYPSTIGVPTRPEFNGPYSLLVQTNHLYFELFGDATFANYRIKELDLETKYQVDKIDQILFELSKHFYYTVFDNKIYFISLSDFRKGPFGSSEHVLNLIEYQGFPQGLTQPSTDSNKLRRVIPLHRRPDIVIEPHELRAASEGTFYLSDIKNHQIWKIVLNKEKTQGELSVLAGSGEKGYRDGMGTDASFYVPSSLTVDSAGDLYVADTGNHAIRKVTPEGIVTTFYRTENP